MNTNNDERGENKIREFVAWAVREKGIPETERTSEEERVREDIEARMRKEILHSFSLDKLVEVNNLIDKDELTEEKLGRLIDESGIRLESVAKKVLEEFRAEYLPEMEIEAEEEE